MKNTRVLIMVALALPFVYSCDDDDAVDTTAPTITLEDPVAGESVAAGGMLDVHCDLADDINLATYSITIHDNFDGHSHGRTLANFNYDESFTVEGTTAHIEQEIAVDATSTAGPYHFIMQAIDAAGNATSFDDDSSVEIEIWLTNETMAHVHFEDQAGAEISELEGTVGQNLSIYGEVDDESGSLDHILVVVGHLDEESDEGHSHGRIREEEIFEKEFEVEGQTSVSLAELLADESIVIGQAELDELEDGEHLYLIVTATDEEGNISRGTIEIHFD